jgi:hypothetical protein
MNAKTLIILAVILVALAVLVVVRQSRRERPTLIEQAGVEVLMPSSINTANIKRIELYAGNAPEEKLAVARDDANAPWRVVSHYSAPASDDMITRFTDALFKLRGDLREEAPAPERLEEYGLGEEAAFHVAVYTDTGDTPAVHLLVGKAAQGGTVFMRRADEMRIFDDKTNLRTTAGIYGEDQTPQPNSWLNMQVLDLDADATLTRVAVALPDKQITFAREQAPRPETEAESGEDAEEPAEEPEPEFVWTVAEGGPEAEFKPAIWENNLRSIKSLRASDIVDPAPLADYGLDEPAYRAVISVEGREDDIVIEGGRPTRSGEGFIRVAGVDPPVVYKLFSSTFEQVFPKTGNLFNFPKLADWAAADQVERVEIAREGAPLIVMEQGEDGWRVVQPAAGLEIQQDTLRQVATAIAAITPADYAAPDAETGPFAWTITATMGGQQRVLRLGADSKSIDGVYARFGDATAVYAIRRTDANRLMLAPKDIFQLRLFDVAMGDVAAIEAAMPDKRARLEKQGENWVADAEGARFEPDQALARTLATGVLDFQAMDLRTDVTAPPAGAEPLHVFTVTDVNGGVHTLQFFEAPEGEGKLLVFADGMAHAMESDRAAADVIGRRINDVVRSRPAPEGEEETGTAETAEEAAAVGEAESVEEQALEDTPVDVQVVIPSREDGLPAVTPAAPGDPDTLTLPAPPEPVPAPEDSVENAEEAAGTLEPVTVE